MYLAEAIMERKGLYAQGLHALQLLLVEVLQLIHGQIAVPVQIHTPGKQNNL